MALSEALADFSLNLFRVSAKPQENGFLSPVSIAMALGVTYAGADGETAKQMNKVIFGGLKANEIERGMSEVSEFFEKAKSQMPIHMIDGMAIDRSAPTHQIDLANKIYGQKGYSLYPKFVETLLKSYHSKIETVDFSKNEEVCHSINEWVKAVTKGRIEDLLSPNLVDDFTRLLVVNAIYFKAEWEIKFKGYQYTTKEKTFHAAPVQVSMMKQKSSFEYKELADVQVLNMYYKNCSLAMVVFLPKQKYGLADFEKKLNGKRLHQMIDSTESELVVVEFPKFRMDQSFGLKETLVHKAFIEVNEEGTEAAACTAVLLRGGGPPPPPREEHYFTADHPFLFVIYDHRLETILFMGHFYGSCPPE